jgi:hypothetical protein
MLKMRCPELDEKSQRYMDRMSRSAQTLNDLIKRVQALYQNRPKIEFPYTDSSGLVIRLATVIPDDELFDVVEDFLSDHRHRFHIERWTHDDLNRKFTQKNSPDILLVDYACCFMQMERLLEDTRRDELTFPVVCLADAGADRALAIAMTMGVMDYLPKTMLTRPALGRMLCYALDRFMLMQTMRESTP